MKPLYQQEMLLYSRHKSELTVMEKQGRAFKGSEKSIVVKTE
ncbi:hypothetical protein SE957_07855 [Escherichia coli]|nr:hypothetical protein [Escherichia coli]